MSPAQSDVSPDAFLDAKKRIETIASHVVAPEQNASKNAQDEDIAVEKLRSSLLGPGLQFRASDPKCVLAWRKFLISSSKAFNQGWKNQWINDYSLFSPGGVTSQDDAMGKG